MKIYISSDHAGYELKEFLIAHLKEREVAIEDKGPFEFNRDDDYPDLISLVAEEVAKDPDNTKGIIIGLSGQGEAMVANRFKGVRAGVYYGGPDEVLQLMREHNDANILSLGAKFVTSEQAAGAVDIWLAAEFSYDERHQRRIAKIESLGGRMV